MTQEEKSLLLKDLCARLPYGVKVQDELGRINKLVIGNADLIRLYYNDFSIYGENALSLPFLRPMSSMTEEEKDERRQIVTAVYDGEVIDDVFVNVVQYMDWLNAHHFDFHNLIEKKLALEAPEGMYNLNK